MTKIWFPFRKKRALLALLALSVLGTFPEALASAAVNSANLLLVRHLTTSTTTDPTELMVAIGRQQFASHLAPGRQPVARVEARLMLATRPPSEVIPLLGQYVESFPHDSVMWFELGQAEIEAGRTTDGILSLRRAGAERYFLNQAYELRAKGDLEGAQQAVGLAVQIAPDLAEAYALQGEIYFAKGDARAMASLGQAASVSRDPSVRASALTRMGDILVSQKAYDEAINLYDQALQLQPNDPHTLASLAQAIYFSSRERKSEAIAMAKKAIQVAPAYVWGYLALGDIYKTDNEIQMAQYWYGQAVDIAPDHPAPYIALGNLYLAMGSQEEARSLFETALRLGGGDAARHGLQQVETSKSAP